MKLLRISIKIWFFLIGIIITTVVFLSFILLLKIEMKISVILKINDYGTKILITPEHINYIVPKKKIILNINQQFLETQISNIQFNQELNVYEVKVNNLPPLMPNSSISAQIIYGHLRVIDYIFSTSV